MWPHPHHSIIIPPPTSDDNTQPGSGTHSYSCSPRAPHRLPRHKDRMPVLQRSALPHPYPPNSPTDPFNVHTSWVGRPSWIHPPHWGYRVCLQMVLGRGAESCSGKSSGLGDSERPSGVCISRLSNGGGLNQGAGPPGAGARVSVSVCAPAGEASAESALGWTLGSCLLVQLLCPHSLLPPVPGGPPSTLSSRSPPLSRHPCRTTPRL